MLFQKKPGLCLVVEMGPSFLKWVIAKQTAGPSEPVELGVLEWTEHDEPSQKKAAQNLSEISRKYKITTAATFCSIPRFAVTVRNLEIPSTDPVEIKKMIDLQAVKQTPYGSDEIVFDYTLLTSGRQGYSNVMLVVAHRQVIHSVLRFLESAGLKSEHITFGAAANPAWTLRSFPDISFKSSTAILDVDRNQADFLMVQNGQVIFSQSISTQSSKVVSDLSRALGFYHNEELGKDAEKLFITGAVEVIDSQIPAVAQLLSVSAQEKPDREALQDISTPDKSIFSRYSFSGLLAICAKGSDNPINLVPQETVVQASLLEKSRHLLMLGVLIFSLFLASIGIVLSVFYAQQKALRNLQTQMTAVEGESVVVQERRQRIKDIINLSEDSDHLFNELAQIYRVAPKEIYITELSVNEERRLVIQGRSDSMTGIFDFVNALKANSLFHDLDTQRMTKRIINNKEVVDFQIDAKLHAPPSFLRESSK